MFSKQEEYFLAIVEAGSISRAAKNLYLSQPALSGSLKRLEDELGVQLFSRDTYPLQLTQAGRLFFQYVQKERDLAGHLRQELIQLEREPSGTVRIGFTFWRSSLVLPRVLPQFHRKYPLIQVELHEGSHQELAALMDQGRLDLALFHRPNPYPQFSFEHLKYEHILLAVSTDAPAAGQLAASAAPAPAGVIPHLPMTALSVLQDTPFFLLQRGQNLREISNHIFRVAGIQPTVILTTHSMVTVLKLAAAGQGATWCSDAILEDDHLPSRLLFFTVGSPSVQWEVGFAAPLGAALSPAAHLLMGAIREAFGDSAVRERDKTKSLPGI